MKLEKKKFPVDLVTCTEEILNGKLQFLCSVLLHETIWSLSKAISQNIATSSCLPAIIRINDKVSLRLSNA